MDLVGSSLERKGPRGVFDLGLLTIAHGLSAGVKNDGEIYQPANALA